MKQCFAGAETTDNEVTPRVGVWIETLTILQDASADGVTPRVGVWIETGLTATVAATVAGSPPAWGCGLKRTLVYRGWAKTKVTPRVGVWIETVFLASRSRR